MIDFKVKIGKVSFNNPVMVASGTYGYGKELADFFNPQKIGAIVTKTITPKSRAGNPAQRICETPSGMLNAIGLANKGIDYFIHSDLPYLAGLKTRIIVSISADSDKGFLDMIKHLDGRTGVDAIELNLSCPNLNKKVLVSQDELATRRLIAKTKKHTKVPIIAKLSPNVTDIKKIARAAEDAGADAVSAINTLYGMAIDVHKKEPVIENITGGLSGPAIKPVALKMVWDIASTVKIPVIAIGGIMNTQDAAEFFLAGAEAIQVGTANFLNPLAAPEIVKGLTNYMKKNKYKKIRDMKKDFQKNLLKRKKII